MMLKALKVFSITAVLCILSIVGEVWADGYEVETVGGVLSPTNFVMTLSLAVFLCMIAFGFIAVAALIRMKKTDHNEDA